MNRQRGSAARTPPRSFGGIDRTELWDYVARGIEDWYVGTMRNRKYGVLGAALTALPLLMSCGEGSSQHARTESASTSGASAPAAEPSPNSAGTTSAGATPATTGRTAQPENGQEARTPSLGLLIATSQFRVENGSVTANPGPARLELLIPEGEAFRTEVVEDPSSNVFHKAMVFQPPNQPPGIVTLGGMAASVKLWRRGPSGWTSETLWTEQFGGRVHRMRDAEIADLYGDGPAIAVGTHDQGVVAVLRNAASGHVQIERIDRQANTFIHEIEIGDLNRDGTLEVYATPSEPNDLEGGEQRGQVVRYVPRAGRGRTVVADLGNRHAKEIWVGDVDGDHRDELYVAVEALTRSGEQQVDIVEPVEIRRYDADTPPTARVVIATLRDRLTRFLTVGDVDGDGRREMVVAAFRSGLWLLRPGRDPHGEWSTENIDRESSGFEHAALLTDLDRDGRDELYVGADEQGELRRYLWVNGRPRRETLLRREVRGAIMTWNLMPFPVSLLSGQ